MNVLWGGHTHGTQTQIPKLQTKAISRKPALSSQPDLKFKGSTFFLISIVLGKKKSIHTVKNCKKFL